MVLVVVFTHSSLAHSHYQLTLAQLPMDASLPTVHQGQELAKAWEEQ
jgi:hypothetical protein